MFASLFYYDEDKQRCESSSLILSFGIAIGFLAVIFLSLIHI